MRAAVHRSLHYGRAILLVTNIEKLVLLCETTSGRPRDDFDHSLNLTII